MAPALVDDDHAVRDAFVQWTAMQRAAPRHAEALIEHLEVSHEYAGLLATEIEGRRIVWKSVPAAARTRVTAADVTPDYVDMWTAESESLRRGSIHIATCDSCAGEKKLRCSACHGSGRQTCSACNGQRKSYGYASNGAYRLLNCAGCRGKGDVDCGHCRRGVAICSTCAGEGKLQRWLEIESWQRSAFNAYPPAIAAQLHAGAVTDDAELAAEIDQPSALTTEDLVAVPQQWLELLRPDLAAGERVLRQRLQIARVPVHRVHYRLGSANDSVTFTGRRLHPPVSSIPENAFDRRASRLRGLRILLFATAVVITLTSLARDAFFRSVFTCSSIVACNSALIAIDVFANDWTSARLHAPLRVVAAAALLMIAIAFAIAALPRAAHARQLIASGNIDDAEAELRLLQSDAPAALWADVHLARIERTTDLDAAREHLVQIPHALPQYNAAANGVAHIATNVARSKVERSDWSEAAKAIVIAKTAGADERILQPLTGAIENTAVTAAAEANGIHDPAARLKRRREAEAIFLSWQRATGATDTPQVIALRVAMARDVATLEHQHKQ